jgi:hypothetical protein
MCENADKKNLAIDEEMTVFAGFELLLPMEHQHEKKMHWIYSNRSLSHVFIILLFFLFFWWVAPRRPRVFWWDSRRRDLRTETAKISCLR